jgi:hypothetical protein
MYQHEYRLLCNAKPITGAVLIKNLEKYFSKFKFLKYGNCRYEHAE